MGQDPCMAESSKAHSGYQEGDLSRLQDHHVENVVGHDPLTDRVKCGYHVQVEEGFNNFPLAKFPPNVVLMDCHKERVPAESLTIMIPPFVASEHPFLHKDNVSQGSVRI